VSWFNFLKVVNMIASTESRARYTSQEAVEMIGNRFEMVLIASARVRELKRGHKSLLDKPTNAGPIVTALMEIEKGLVGRDYLRKV
jgi:DNA-directed RNA polymerase subunit omega